MADAAGAHFQDEVVRGRVGHGDGEGQADLVVEGLRRGHHSAGGRKQLGDEVLGRRLPGGPGDRDDLGVHQGVRDEVPAEAAEGGEDVVDENRGDSDRPRGEHRGGARLHGGEGVVVAVGLLAGQGHEEGAGLGLAGVEHGRRGHEGFGVGGVGEGAADDLGDGRQEHGLHGGVFPVDGVAGQHRADRAGRQPVRSPGEARRTPRRWTAR